MRFFKFVTSFACVALLAAGCGGGGGSAGTVSGSGGPQALFTTAPQALSLTIGTPQTFTVGGGKSPYTAVSSDSSVAAAGIAGSSLTLGGVTPGTSTVTIRDALGATASVNVTSKPTRALFTTAPSPLTIAIGLAAAQTYQVGGGLGPYVVGNSNPSVLQADLSGTTLKLTGLAAGNANVVILDSVGGSTTIAVTVPASATVDLFSTSAPAVTIPVGRSGNYIVGGGTGAYTVTSSNEAVALATLNGSGLTIAGLANGSAVVTLRDSAGHAVLTNVTVQAASVFYTTAPSAVTIALNSSAAYTVGGGVAPYSATSSNESVATALLSGGTLTITAKTAGTANVVLRDAANSVLNVAVSVTPPTTLDLFTTAPPSVTLSKNQVSGTYSIAGGTPPYTVTSSNTNVVTVASVSSTSFTLKGVNTGSANVVIADSIGKSISVAVTVTAAQMIVSPSAATAYVGDTLKATINGGSGSYSAVSSFPDAASVSVSGSTLTIIAKQAVNPDIITVTDSNGNTATFSLTVSAATNQIALSPNALSVSACIKPAEPFTLTLYGAAPGTAYLFSSDVTQFTVQSSVTVTGNATAVIVTPVVPVGDQSVTITAIDAKAAVATSVINVKTPSGACPP